MKIKKVDDKPMVIHTKEKAKIHAHEPKGAKIKGSNIYTVERGPKVHDAKANEMDKKASAKLMLQKSAGGKRTYRKSTIHQSEAKDKGLSRFKRNIRESGTSIKTKNTNLHIAGRTGALAAGAVTEQVEGGQEVSQAAYLAYESSRPVTGTASKGAALFRKKAAAEAKKRIKKVEAGKKLAKKTAKKAAKDTAKTVAKETAKETAKTTAKVATKTATKAAATAAGTAVAPGVGTAIGMAAGYAAGVSIEVKDEKMTNRSRKIKFFLDKMKAQENQTDSVAKLVKDLIVRKAITWVKAAAPIVGLVLLLLVLVVAMIAVPVIAAIAILYNSPFALFLPPLESGDNVQTVTSAYVQEFNRDVNTKVNEHTGYELGELANVREDVKTRDKELIDNPEFAITIGKATYTERVDGGTMMLEAISKCKTGETTAIGKFHGFELLVEKNFLGINYMVLRGKTEYKAELSTSPVGSMVKLENLFNGLHENIDFLEKKIEQYQNDLEASKTEYDKPFAYSKELEEKLARQCELNAQLDLENAKAVDADLSGPEKERETDDRMEAAAIVAEDKGAYLADREGRTR